MSFFLDLWKTQDAQKANLENKNKHELVLQHLQKKGSITSWEAINLYRATRLSSIIYRLRDRGLNITTTMVEKTNSKGHISKYGIFTLLK